MQRILLLTIIGFLLVNCQESICDRNIQAGQETAVSGVVTGVINTIFTEEGEILQKFFNGSHENQTTNYAADDEAKSVLTGKLTQSFMGGLGCSEMYSNATDLDIINTHKNLNIKYAEHALFNTIVVKNLNSFSDEDKLAVFQLLDGLRGDVCKHDDCFSICHKYLIAGVNSSFELVKNVVANVVQRALDSPLAVYFDGTKGNRPNYTNDEGKLVQLLEHLVQFFGQVLGCDDGTIPPYMDRLQEAHKNMGITLADFNAFNEAIVAVVTEAGLKQVDIDTIKIALEGTRSVICTDDTDCNPNRGSSGGDTSDAQTNGSSAQTNGSSAQTNGSSAQTNGSSAQNTSAGSSAAQSSNAVSSNTPNPPEESSSSDAATLFFSVIALIALLF